MRGEEQASGRVIYLLQRSMGELVDVLQWYAEQVAGCRKLTSEGEVARAALDADGGKRARDVLSSKSDNAAQCEISAEYLDALQRYVDAQKPIGFKLTPIPQPDIKEP